MITADYHLHSAFSSDSSTPLEEQVKAAITRYHLENMCVTDHMDFDFPDNPEGLTFLFDMENYLQEIHRLQQQYKNQVHLYTGIELGLLPHLGPRLTSFMETYGTNLDFVIASSHLVQGMDPYNPEFFETYGEKEGITLYLQTILDNITAFTDFDVYGHLDYVVRYAPHKDAHYVPSDYWDYFDAILQKLITMGKGIELNTAGLKAGLSFAHPHPLVLKRYRELGGEILTIGSDGHCPEHLSYQFKQVPAILKEAGFSYYTIFIGRKAEFLPL